MSFDKRMKIMRKEPNNCDKVPLSVWIELANLIFFIKNMRTVELYEKNNKKTHNNSKG